jgi:hypothetical protein
MKCGQKANNKGMKFDHHHAETVGKKHICKWNLQSKACGCVCYDKAIKALNKNTYLGAKVNSPKQQIIKKVGNLLKNLIKKIKK